MLEMFFFGGFLVVIAGLLALDLGLYQPSKQGLSFKEAILKSALWISLALLFYAFLAWKGEFIHGIQNADELAHILDLNRRVLPLEAAGFEQNIAWYRQQLALEFISGYVLEYALSIDNIFVIILIFTTFSLAPKHFHRVLFWGVLGAVLMRFCFIFLGSALISRFEWILYLFGIFLVYTGTMLFIKRNKTEALDVAEHPIVQLASQYFAVFPRYVGAHFCIKKAGKCFITPLLLTLLVVEFTDLIFAVDSIPAIFAVTRDPYIVFFSNIFAILGLRSLFFVLIHVLDKFHYLKIGLSVLLVFIGLKMLAHHQLQAWGFSTLYSLYVILGILATSILASLLFPKQRKIATEQ